MNSSPTGWIVLTLLCLGVVFGAGMVAGQVKPTPPPYEEPAERQADEGICYELMVKKLYAATDESDPLQEGYLRSAEAYRQLALEHQRCQ